MRDFGHAIHAQGDTGVIFNHQLQRVIGAGIDGFAK